MRKHFKRLTSLLSITIFFFIALASGEESKSSDAVKNQTTELKINIGSTYSIDAYHQIQFKTASRYWIYQKPLNCGGEGNWSQEGDKIILGPNDSNCESTRKIKGEYSLDQILN